ncbi:MAG: acyltransferase family protein [Azospirillaceae bacterium]|nr:acyltransferase family protein [Azospirillaceae bacterium]
MTTSSPNQPPAPDLAAAAPRNAGLDALRAALTLLVLFHHTAITYGAMGGWYYHEVLPSKNPGSRLLILFCTVNQAYFMGLFFLLAGFFTPRAVAHHGPWRYLRERLLRLGAPLLIYVLAIGPATIALAQTVKAHPFVATLMWQWQHGTFDNGPLWFAQALLIFALAFLVWRALRSPRIAPPFPPPFPSNRMLGAAALATGAAAFILRLAVPVGTSVAGLQLGYFASYIVLFAAGCVGAGGNWLTTIPQDQRRLWLRTAWLTLPVLPIVVLLAPAVPVLQGNIAGGWNVQATLYAFWEPLVAWGFIMALLQIFQRKFARLSTTGAALARRAYTIFIIHPPVLVAIALAWRAIAAPPLIKFALTGSATCLACFWLAGLLLRVPLLRRIL